jgi:glycosyltransferase involved in cell wall biosynthesis
MLSVLILTRNEESDLGACLSTVDWSGDIHVFDSFSTDRTAEIARAAGATVTQRAFDGYASQRNAALHGLTFRCPWVLILDADERVPEALVKEIEGKISNADDSVGGFRIRRRDFFMGKWLKHAQISPFFIRLVRPESAHYEREVNEVIRINGTVRELEEPFDHFPFSKGLSRWVDKHNSYSTMEAKRWLDERLHEPPFSIAKALLSHDFNERRYHQKGLFYRFPCRPLIKFVYMMLARRAFLDGNAGVTYAVLQSFYEYLIVLKQREIKAKQNIKGEGSGRFGEGVTGKPLPSSLPI